MDLIETLMTPMVILEESSAQNGGKMKVKGIFAVADEVNGNGRVYRESILDREIEKLKEQIAENSAYSEGDHPEDGKSRIANTVAMLTGINKKIVDNRKIYEGESVILPTTKGKDLQVIIRAGGKIGVSSRGWGSLQKGNWNGVTADIVQEDFGLKTFDFVIGQSTKDATIAQFNEQMDVINILSVEGKPAQTKSSKGGLTIMEIKNLEELRKAFPELCLQLEKETKEKVEKELKEQYDKEIEKRVLAEIESKREELKTEIIQEVRDSDEFGKPLASLVEIAKIVKPYISEETAEEDAAAKLEQLQKDLDASKKETKGLKEQIENDKKAAETKVLVGKKIEEVTAGEKFGKQIAERLGDCKTVEEVTKRFESEKKFVAQLTETKVEPKGEGKTGGKEEEGQQLTEAQIKQRRAAGIE